ncbi:MAG: glutamate synthase domain-containing protein 1 [Parasphingorhabdus sp.]|jgi:glutamate synthase domain-containing protein 1
MCGIAGRILREYGAVGNDLVELMDAQSHRGADSTGFAIYTPPCERGYKLRLMGFSRKNIDNDLDDFRHILKSYGSDFIEEPTVNDSEAAHYSVRMLIDEPKDLNRWIQEADLISNRIEVQSLGKCLEIIKDTGDASSVADKHGVRDMMGTHGLGHARLATESSVLPNASHPFWARPFPDVAIVHNGQITDYFTQRDRLQREGYRFMTENDSELIAVWISDQMSKGLSKEEALKKSIGAIDGVFTFMISDASTIGFAKDRFAMKPLVTVEDYGELAAATEEQAVRRVVHDESHVTNYDGPSLTNIWAVGQQQEAA